LSATREISVVWGQNTDMSTTTWMSWWTSNPHLELRCEDWETAYTPLWLSRICCRPLFWFCCQMLVWPRSIWTWFLYFYIFICLFVCLFFGFGVYLHEVIFVESHLQRFKPYTHYTAVTGVPYHIHNEVQESIVWCTAQMLFLPHWVRRKICCDCHLHKWWPISTYKEYTATTSNVQHVHFLKGLGKRRSVKEIDNF
jgi:hypothetical protein